MENKISNILVLANCLTFFQVFFFSGQNYHNHHKIIADLDISLTVFFSFSATFFFLSSPPKKLEKLLFCPASRNQLHSLGMTKNCFFYFFP